MPGYPILDSDKQNLEDKFICEYCQSVLRDATRASCGHFFCSSCVKHLFLSNPQGVCSRTGLPLFHYEFSPDAIFCNEVLDLEVHCLFFDSGCHWYGQLHDFEDHVGNCSVGSCQGKETGQVQECERYSQLEASGGKDLRRIPGLYPKCDVPVNTTNDLMEPLENECLSRLEICGLCNERVSLNDMKLHQSEECRASPAKLGKGGIRQVKKEQLNFNDLQRQVPILLTGSKVSKIKNSQEKSLQFTGEIAPTPKEVTSGNSDTRNTSSRNSITDQHEQRLRDLENRVAQHDLLIRENSLLKQNIIYLVEAFHDISNKVNQVQHTLDCQKRDFDAFQENLNALQNEQIHLQDLQHGELARLNRSMEVIQARIARLERHSQSHKDMLANMVDRLTALADAVERVWILGVDIQHV